MISATLKSPGSGGTRTHDLWVTSPSLDHLLYQATDGNGAWMNPHHVICAQEFRKTDMRRTCKEHTIKDFSVSILV